MEFKSDPGVMLFNLTTQASFQCINTSRAIWCGKNSGPVFGYGELSGEYEPLNKSSAFISSTKFHNSAYNIPRNSEGINKLTNEKCDITGTGYFTISEIEVWGVSFND